jgi:putative FmdB family regulatory protein
MGIPLLDLSLFSEATVPVYEYRCHDCRRRVSILWRSFAEAERGESVCPRCGSTNLVRLVSRVRAIRSEESRLEDMADPSFLSDFDEDDPRSMGRMMRRMADEVGEDMGPEFDEVVGRLEAGENPEEIEKSIPDLLGEEGGGDLGEL